MARLLAGVVTVVAGPWPDHVAQRGALAVRIELDGRLDTAVTLVVDGRITRIHAVRNPQKLARVDEPAPLSR